MLSGLQQSLHVESEESKPQSSFLMILMLSMCGQYRRSLPGLHVFLPVLVDAGKILYMNIYEYNTCLLYINLEYIVSYRIRRLNFC